MKTILTLMATFAIATNLQAWDAPQPVAEPSAVDFVVGQTYYIRNVGCGQYMASGNSWATQLSFTVNKLQDEVNQPLKIKFEEASTTMDGVTVSGYSLYLNGTFNSYGNYNRTGAYTVGKTYIFRATEEQAFVDYNDQGKGWIWNLIKTNQGYYRITTAATDPAYPATNQYAGWDGTAISADTNGATQNSVVMNLTLGNINWELIDAEAYDAKVKVYEARLRLYTTLQKADAAGVSTTSAGAVYTNNAATVDEIDSARRTLAFEIVKAGWDSDEVTMEKLTPSPDTLVSGKYYYLYNVDAQMFLGRSLSNSSYPNLRNYVGDGQRIRITKQSNGYYTMQYNNNNNYIGSSGSECYTSSYLYNDCYWHFVDAGEGLFYIQRNYSYNSNQYLGWVGATDSRLYSDKPLDSSKNIRWQLIDADEDVAAMAQRMMLLKSVEYAGGTELWPKYFAMITDESQTATTLYDAAAQLNKSIDNSKTDVPTASWNEVAMKFWSDDTWEKSTSDGGYYLSYCSSDWGRNTDGECSLWARVNVPELSKLGFDTYANAADVNFSLFIDGEELKTLNYHELENYYIYSGDEGRITELYDYYGTGTTRTYRRYFVDITAGLHTIEWRYSKSINTNTTFYLRNLGILPCPTTVSVNCVEPGSLGNEVLYHVDNVNDVRRLKIKGTINDDDWARIKMMTRLVALDLSETTITSLPAKKFDNYSSVQWPYLSELVLPNGLKNIGDYCFRFSYVNQIDLPDSVETIGEYAFYNTQISRADIKSSVKSIGEGAFSCNYFLTDVSYKPSQTMTTIPAVLFEWCRYMKPFDIPSQTTVIDRNAFDGCYLFDTILPEGLTTVNYRAFYATVLASSLPSTISTVGNEAFIYCHKLNFRLPADIKTIGNGAFRETAVDTLYLPDSGVTIGEYAFYNCDSLKILRVPESATSIGQYAFAECNKLASVEMPTSYYTITNQYLFANDHAIKKLRLKSPTMITGNKSTFLNGVTRGNVTLQIPEHLVTTYKQDDYWYTYGGFEAIPSEEINYWLIQQPLKLTYRDRFQGNPDVDILGNGHLTINGDAAMNLNNVMTYQNQNWPSSGTTAMVLSNCDNIVINGKLTHKIHTTNDIWYAMSLPFDFKVSDIIIEDNAKYAIRYYDGAHRAEYGNGGNWVDLPADTVVTAGTGFIYRTSKECKSYFVAQNNGSKQTMFGNSEFAKQLQPNPSEDEEHKGWNLVGNPYQCYYNIHKLNTTAPITVYNHGSWHGSGWYNNVWHSSAWLEEGSYKAYSLIDDDYALLPNAAFFLQCPDEATTITFPTTGKQLTSEIEDQNGVKAFMQRPELRKLIDLRLSTKNAGQTEDAEGVYDQTRVVFNAAASLGYERNCDAGKFLTEDKTLPQLYTLDEDGTRYAINERPTCGEATVPMGVIIPRAGTYYIYVSRNRQAGTVLLLDRETGTTTDITDTPYSFQTDAGTFNDRFLLVAQSLATGVEEVEADNSQFTIHNSQLGGAAYDMSGRRVRMNQMTPGVYVVRHGNRTQKITVK